MQETVLDPYVRRQAVALKAGLAQAQQVCEQVLCCGQVLLPAVGSCGSGGGGGFGGGDSWTWLGLCRSGPCRRVLGCSTEKHRMVGVGSRGDMASVYQGPPQEHCLRSMGKEGIEALFSLQKGFKEGLLAGCQVPFSHP